MKAEIEADEYEYEEFTMSDYAQYVLGFGDYDEKARLNGRSYEEQQAHDANGGDWVIR